MNKLLILMSGLIIMSAGIRASESEKTETHVAQDNRSGVFSIPKPLAKGDQPGDKVRVIVGMTTGATQVTQQAQFSEAIVLNISGNKAGIDENDICAVTVDNGFISCLSGKNFTNVGVSEARGGTNFPAFYKNFIGSYVVSSSGMPGGNVINVYCDGPCQQNQTSNPVERVARSAGYLTEEQ